MESIDSSTQLVTMFQEEFAHLTPQTVLNLDRLYAPEIVFEDPMHRVVGLKSLTEYFARLNARIESADFVFDPPIIAVDRAVLTWSMTVRIPRPRQTIVVPGCSVLTIANNKITSQRDYFDVGNMLYERLPIIGWVLRRVKKMAG